MASSKYFRFVFYGWFLKRQFYGLYSALGKRFGWQKSLDYVCKVLMGPHQKHGGICEYLITMISPSFLCIDLMYTHCPVTIYTYAFFSIFFLPSFLSPISLCLFGISVILRNVSWLETLSLFEVTK